MSERRLLIVEDDTGFARVLAQDLGEAGFAVRCAEDLTTAADALSDWSPSHAVVDLRLHGVSGLAVIESLRVVAPGCRIVVLTGYGSVPTAVEAVKRGAAEYLTKPVSTEHLLAVLTDDLPARPLPDKASRESLARHEHEYIEYVLARCDGNVSKAARWLGIHRQSLQRKLRKYPPRR